MVPRRRNWTNGERMGWFSRLCGYHGRFTIYLDVYLFLFIPSSRSVGYEVPSINKQSMSLNHPRLPCAKTFPFVIPSSQGRREALRRPFGSGRSRQWQMP